VFALSMCFAVISLQRQNKKKLVKLCLPAIPALKKLVSPIFSILLCYARVLGLGVLVGSDDAGSQFYVQTSPPLPSRSSH